MKHFIIFIISVTLISCADSSKKTAQYEQSTKNDVAQTPLEKSIAAGALVYKDFCNQCHRPKGKGVGKSFPPLAGSNWLTEKRTESIHAVKYGLQGEIVVNNKTFDGVMAAQGLSDQETMDVMNYIMNTWGNTQDEMVTIEEVKAVTK